MIDRQRLYREECLMDALVELWDIPEWERVLVFDELLAAATEMLDAQETGVVMHYDMLIVLEEVESGMMGKSRYLYKAYQEKDVPLMGGCRHGVDAASLKQARIDARILHERKRGCVWKAYMREGA